MTSLLALAAGARESERLRSYDAGIGPATAHRGCMSDFRKLHVWRKAHALALNSHRVAAAIRGAEYVSTRSQIIRAALSIPTNIVEGRGQKSAKEQCRFVGYAINSTSELEYHLLVAKDLEKISDRDFDSLRHQLVEVRKMLHGLLNYLSGQ